MKKHFINYIKIKSHKCFKDFEVDGFARVNLIGGKNNVGKTAFLEACQTNVFASNVESFAYVLVNMKYRRERINNRGESQKLLLAYLENTSNLNISSNIRKCSFKVVIKDGIKEYQFSIGDKTISVNSNEFSLVKSGTSNALFMSSLGATDSALIKNYSSLQKNDKEGYLNDYLKKIDNKINSFKIIEDIPQCKVGSSYIEISDMGDGIRHLINIVSSLYTTKNGQLFIDEIDKGLHYTLLDDVWNIILTLSKKLNVQVFATTHSKECIESYARVSEKLIEKEVTYTILTKLDDGKIDAGVYDSEMLVNTLEQDHEVRGW